MSEFGFVHSAFPHAGKAPAAGDALMTARVLHPYEAPCFPVLPIEGGNDDYLTWARARLSIG